MRRERKNLTVSNRWKIVFPLGLLAILVILIGLYSRRSNPKNSAVLLTDNLSYSLEGPFQVGIATQTILAETPFDVVVWYPGLVNSSTSSISYDYEIKFRKPLGRTTIAAYKGNAIPQASFDFSQAPYPLVVLSPGFSITPAAYGWLAEHLASYGFVVIAPDHLEILNPENELWRSAITRPQDILAVLDHVDEQTGVGSRYEGLIDPELVAVAGHSYGGYTSLLAAGARIDTHSFQTQCEAAILEQEPGTWLCEKLLPHIDDMADLAGLDSVPEGLWPVWADERVDAIISMAGNAFFFSPAGLSEITVPVLAIGGTADDDSPFKWSTHPTYEYVSSKRKIKIALLGAEHMIFTGTCEKISWYMKAFSGEFCVDQSWDRSYAHDLIKHFTTAFLLAELKQDVDADAVLVQEKSTFQNVEYQIQK